MLAGGEVPAATDWFYKTTCDCRDAARKVYRMLEGGATETREWLKELHRPRRKLHKDPQSIIALFLNKIPFLSFPRRHNNHV